MATKARTSSDGRKKETATGSRIEQPAANHSGERIAAADLKRAERELLEAKEYAESIVETIHEPLLVLHPNLTVKSCNAAFYASFRVNPADTIGQRIYDLGNGQWNIPALRTLLEDVLPDSKVFNDFEVDHVFDSIGRRVMLLNARRLDHVQLILLGIRDVTADRDDVQRAIAVRLMREQERISGELHDSVGQQLVGAKMLTEAVADALEQQHAPQAKLMRRLATQLDETLDQVRRISRGLRPVEVDEMGLEVALQRLVESCRETAGIECRFECPRPVPVPNPTMAEYLYHIAQEAAQNALKHGSPKTIVIGLEQVEGRAVLEVRDDGEGFEPNQQSYGLGQRTMRQRAELIGAQLDVTSGLGQGTTVRCAVKNL